MKTLGVVGQTLKAGQSGTQKWLQKYGEQLALVRYRYDADRKTRQTTIELVVEETPWVPPRAKTVLVEVRWEENNLRSLIKRAGGKWLPEVRRWEITHETAKRLGLQNRLDN